MNKPSGALGMLSIAALACIGVALTIALHRSTAPQISAAQEAAQSQALLSVLPADSYDNQPLKHPLTLPPRTPDTQAVIAAYLVTRGEKPSAVLFQSQAEGYVGPIELLIAVSFDGQLMGVKVLKQNETAGLGDRIVTKPDWLARFLGKSLNNPDESAWALKKDNGQFDQIAGATVTSRATVEAIHQTLRFFDAYRAQLLSTANTGGKQP
ncbi:RnfABCDGE type electron transport complex subunit G [Pseudomonas sp. NA-150]|uniref:RnfABCDGE type electron transport complex subunit G n=1 Tax=Pseudomonas sp. NA-150 TaxID=3367525 RepID=UPI0037C93A7A